VQKETAASGISRALSKLAGFDGIADSADFTLARVGV
jgi:hypothetical protein